MGTGAGASAARTDAPYVVDGAYRTYNILGQIRKTTQKIFWVHAPGTLISRYTCNTSRGLLVKPFDGLGDATRQACAMKRADNHGQESEALG